ncbi:uncharacterized protein LOC127751365 [Frankliniella occidentalis]|uniref:Uncharacterized protein LOC127751365 n=1 Tax=Frankliniella occidentalis TaxID=133901 RepID=A0A9C6X818_FRAOC|nr:uncharacterized protein LOC127751365 [Frankliniella occidentalis]
MVDVKIVTGERSNGTLYVADSFIYCSNRSSGVYNLRCNTVNGCPGTAVYCDGDSYIRTLAAHSHPPDLDEEDRVLFRNALRVDAMSTTLDADEIIAPLFARHPNGSSILTNVEMNQAGPPFRKTD